MSAKEVWYDWGGANVWLFKQINSIHGDYYDLAMRNITLLGDKKLLPYLIAIIAAYAAFSLIGKIVARKGGAKQYFLMWVGVFMVIGASFITVHTTINTIKGHFAYPRPYATISSGEVRRLEFRESEQDNLSFPSGHAAIITVLVLSLWPIMSESFRWFGGGAILTVAWSRIALGVHFPADVAASIIIAFCEVIIIRAVLYWLLRTIFGIRIAA